MLIEVEFLTPMKSKKRKKILNIELQNGNKSLQKHRSRMSKKGFEEKRL